MAAISGARRVALAILLNIEKGQGHSDDLLREDPSLARMSDADRRLTTALVLGVLRWQLQLDQKTRIHMSKPNAKLDPAVLIALRLGAFQLLHLDRIPAHAAINDSVELVKRSGYRSAAGMVNAVLRKIASTYDPQQTPGVLKGHDFSRAPDPSETRGATSSEGNEMSCHPERSAAKRRAVEGSAVAFPHRSETLSLEDSITAHPEWMLERWTNFFGAETACAICIHNQGQASTAIRLPNSGLEQELSESGVTLAAGNLLSSARIVISGDMTPTAAFREGRVRIQDEGSQLIAEIASAAKGGANKILDCCAAPGGKTMILAERNQAAHIVACETSPHRLEQLRARLQILGERVECRLADATAMTFQSEFDLVLADVPCSGTGTLSRNPEIRHRLKPEDLPRQAERQRAILASALRAVGPGGRVIYSTCSLEPEENEQVVRAVVESNQNAEIVPLGSVLETLRDRDILTASGAERLQECCTSEGFLRIVPGAFGTDGFFIAILERRSAQASGYSGANPNSA